MTDTPERAPARDPQDLETLLIERQWVGDIEGMVALYEPDAVLDTGDGTFKRGPRRHPRRVHRLHRSRQQVRVRRQEPGGDLRRTGAHLHPPAGRLYHRGSRPPPTRRHLAVGHRPLLGGVRGLYTCGGPSIPLPRNTLVIPGPDPGISPGRTPQGDAGSGPRMTQSEKRKSHHTPRPPSRGPGQRCTSVPYRSWVPDQVRDVSPQDLDVHAGPTPNHTIRPGLRAGAQGSTALHNDIAPGSRIKSGT